MKLFFLFGRPAVGKLTVARALAARTGGRLFHNHLTVNLVLSVFDFGTPGFVELREKIWMAVLRRALADRVPVLIFTFNPEDTVPQRFLDELFAEFAAAGAEVFPVELTASESAIEARIGSPSRRRDGKTLDLRAYRELRARGAFQSPVVRSPRLRLDTERMTPAEAAAKIAALA
ncbi:MAG TPA: shikimate kinase [Opitutaceae bacterium]|nr:shikimate kinase [Opitutaceae bacterium]